MATAKLRASEVPYNFVGPRFKCAYCGEPADTIDHCTPAWFVEGNLRVIQRYRLFKVSACVDCNARAGMKLDATFLDRRRRIAVSIRRKKRRLLAIADWEPQEARSLGRGLRTYVEGGHQLATVLRRRLTALDSHVLPHGVPNVLMQPLGIEVDDWEEDGRVVRLRTPFNPAPRVDAGIARFRRYAPIAPKAPKPKPSLAWLEQAVAMARAAPQRPWPPVRLFTAQLELAL